MTQPLLHAAGLSLAFGGVRAIDDFSLDMPEPDIVSLIGPNGAGKTSIFNCINGTYRPTSGQLRVLGKDVTRMRPSAVAELGVSRTFQNLRLFSDLTVLDNVRAGMHVRIRQSALDAVLHTPRYRRTERHCTAEAHRWLDFVGFRGERGGRRATCRTGSSGVSRSPGRWLAARSCCCSTSRVRVSTTVRRSSFSTCCGASSSSGSVWCLSNTTWAWSCRCRNGSWC